MTRKINERNWYDELRTWRGTLRTYGTDSKGEHGILSVRASVVNNTRWGWSTCVFSLFIGLIFIVVPQFKCLLLCLRRKWALALRFTDALHYTLQTEWTESTDHYTLCRFLENKKRYAMKKLLSTRDEVLRLQSINFQKKKNWVKIFLFIHLIQSNECYVNKVSMRARVNWKCHSSPCSWNLTGNSQNFLAFECNTQRKIGSSLSPQINGLLILCILCDWL